MRKNGREGLEIRSLFGKSTVGQMCADSSEETLTGFREPKLEIVKARVRVMKEMEAQL